MSSEFGPLWSRVDVGAIVVLVEWDVCLTLPHCTVFDLVFGISTLH